MMNQVGDDEERCSSLRLADLLGFIIRHHLLLCHIPLKGVWELAHGAASLQVSWSLEKQQQPSSHCSSGLFFVKKSLK